MPELMSPSKIKPTASDLASQAHRDRVRRRRPAHVAAFVCPETDRLAKELGFPLAVIAATSDPVRHAARLSATLHGAWTPRDFEAWPLPFDDGLTVPWRDLVYRHLAFDVRWLGPCSLPAGVSLEDGCLAVDLPPGRSASDLSGILQSALIELSYDRVARRPDRVRYRYSRRWPVVVAPRYALLTPGDIDRVVAVDDLFAFRPGNLAFVAQAVARAVSVLAISVAWDDAVAPGDAHSKPDGM